MGNQFPGEDASKKNQKPFQAARLSPFSEITNITNVSNSIWFLI